MKNQDSDHHTAITRLSSYLYSVKEGYVGSNNKAPQTIPARDVGGYLVGSQNSHACPIVMKNPPPHHPEYQQRPNREPGLLFH